MGGAGLVEPNVDWHYTITMIDGSYFSGTVKAQPDTAERAVHLAQSEFSRTLEGCKPERIPACIVIASSARVEIQAFIEPGSYARAELDYG